MEGECYRFASKLSAVPSAKSANASILARQQLAHAGKRPKERHARADRPACDPCPAGTYKAMEGSSPCTGRFLTS